MVTLLILFTLLFYVGQFIENIPAKTPAFVIATILFGGLLFCFLPLTYTADWNMYYYFFKYEDDKTDLVFQFLTILFKKLGLQYSSLYQFHIVISLILVFLWASKFTKNTFFVVLFYLLLDGVHFVNQIRYYLAFPLFLFGVYYLFYKKNYLPAIVFLVLSILSHSGIALLLILIPIYYFVSDKKFHQWIIAISAIFAAFAVYIFNSGLGEILKHFGNYFGRDYLSSVLGGLYNAIPYLLILGFLLYETIGLKRENPEITDDPKFRFLYKLSFFPLVFLPASFFIQIFGHRFIMPFALVWLVYYYSYFIKDQDAKVRLIRFAALCLIGLVCTVFIYVFPDFIFKESHFKEEVLLMIRSHSGLLFLMD